MNQQNSNSWGRDETSNDFEQRRAILGRNQQNDNIRLFIAIKKSDEQNIEYKKLTIMAPLNYKISMLKRLIEKEFADLFPHEPTFICAKLEDEFGYSLSNTSYVNELLKHSDRLTAIAETFSKDLIGKMHVTHDLNELTFMLKSIQQTIIAKLSDANLGSPDSQMEILQLIIPIGFSLQQKAINHNTALTLKRILENERLQFFEDQQFTLVFNLLIKLLTFWVNDLIFQDQFLLNLTVDILEILIKSSKFVIAFKNQYTLNSLMSVSKLDFVSAQTRSRLIKIISYLSKNNFLNTYQPKLYEDQVDIDIPISRGRRAPLQSNQNRQQINYENNNNYQNNNQYIPSIMNNNDNQTSNKRPNSIRGQNDFSLQQNITQSNEFQQNKKQSYNQQIQNNDYNNQNQNNNSNSNNNNNQYLNNQRLKEQNLSLGNNQEQLNRGNMDGQGMVFEGLVQDYINLLNQDSSEDMLIFAVQNLTETIDETIHNIMDNKLAYSQCLNLLEISLPNQYVGMQLRILQAIGKNMNEKRARDGLKLKIIQRILKAFSYQPKEFQGVLYELLTAHLQQSQFAVDVVTVILLIESPYQKISNIGIKILAMISDQNRLSNSNLAIQFENYIKQIMEWTMDSSKGEEFQYNSLITLSNLSLNDINRPQILYLKGVEFFIRILRESQRVDAQRAAAKGLLNLSIKSSLPLLIDYIYIKIGETKLTIVSELDQEIIKIQKGDIDTVVAGYLQTLLTRPQERKQII